MKTTLAELEELFKLKDSRQIKKGLVNKITLLDAENVQVDDEELKKLLAQFRNGGGYDLKEASKVYGISENTLKQLVKHKILSGYKLSSEQGSKLLFLKSELEKENELVLARSTRTDWFRISSLIQPLSSDLMLAKGIGSRNYLIFQLYYFENYSKKQLAQKFNLSEQRIGELNEITQRRILRLVLHGLEHYFKHVQLEEKYNKEIIELQEKNWKLYYENVRLKNEIEKLKKPKARLNQSLLDAGLSEKTLAFCLAHEIKDIKRLGEMTRHSLSYRNFDEETINEIETFLNERGIKLPKGR